MIYILLAAYNEEKDLPGVFEELLREHWNKPFKIILINDGSTDRTFDYASAYTTRLPLLILNHAANRGLGRALATAFSAISKMVKENDVVVTLDADGTHPLSLIPSMEECIRAGNDIAIASRFCKGGSQNGVVWYRDYLSRGAGILLKLLWPLKDVRDYTSGYRMFSGKLLLNVFSKYGSGFITEKGFCATLEILLKASRCTGRISEIPLALHYEKKQGASKMKVMSHTLRTLFFIITLKFRKIPATKPA